MIIRTYKSRDGMYARIEPQPWDKDKDKLLGTIVPIETTDSVMSLAREIRLLLDEHPNAHVIDDQGFFTKGPYMSEQQRENTKAYVTINRTSHGNVYDLRGIYLTMWGYDTPEEEMDAFIDHLDEMALAECRKAFGLGNK